MEVRELTTPAELAAADALAGLIWRTDGATVVPRELLRVFALTGSYVAGAFDGDELVGFAVGVLGRHGGDVELHSHVTGVHPAVQNAGVGLALKAHQRRWALGHGIGVVTWTFDPLVRRNAVFNLAKLGARITDYLVDFYGEMSDGVNAGQGSDRWWVRWDLADPRVEAALGGTPVFVPAGEVATELIDAGGNVVGEPDGASLHVAIPADVEALRVTDAAAARRWRHAVRASLTGALAAGYAVDGVTRDGRYVLSRSPK